MKERHDVNARVLIEPERCEDFYYTFLGKVEELINFYIQHEQPVAGVNTYGGIYRITGKGVYFEPSGEDGTNKFTVRIIGPCPFREHRGVFRKGQLGYYECGCTNPPVECLDKF